MSDTNELWPKARCITLICKKWLDVFREAVHAIQKLISTPSHFLVKHWSLATFFFFFPQKMASYFIKETWYSIVSSMKHFTPEKVASKEMERWQEQRETLLKSESYCGLQGSFHTMSPLICVSEVSLYICVVCQLIAFKLLGYS